MRFGFAGRLCDTSARTHATGADNSTNCVAGDLARCERCALPGFAGLKTNVAHHATIPGSTPLALLDAAAIPSWTLPWPQRARTAWTEQHEQRECDIYDVHHRYALKRVVQAW